MKKNDTKQKTKYPDFPKDRSAVENKHNLFQREKLELSLLLLRVLLQIKAVFNNTIFYTCIKNYCFKTV